VTYAPGQIRHVVEYLPRPPGWLVLGGPSDGDEAMVARQLWPGVHVVAFEPSARLAAWQRANGFPADGRLLRCALADRDGPAPFYPDPSGGTAGGTLRAGVYPDPEPVDCVTLDWADRVCGPFEDALLWLDIEGGEAAALRGAAGLLGSGRVLAVNVETCARTPGDTAGVRRLLSGAGLTLVDEWNRYSGAHQDELWVRA
jgi:FkbM family methyltransferase